MDCINLGISFNKNSHKNQKVLVKRSCVDAILPSKQDILHSLVFIKLRMSSGSLIFINLG